MIKNMDQSMRKILKEDLPALIDFFENNKDADFFDPFPLNKESAEKIINSQNRDLFFGIFFGNMIIGFGMLRWYKDYKSPTLGLIVDNKYQGKGLGKLIYSFLIEKAKEEKCPDIIAIVDKNNIASMHIAKSMGLAEINQHGALKEGCYDFEEYMKKNTRKSVLIKSYESEA